MRRVDTTFSYRFGYRNLCNESIKAAFLPAVLRRLQEKARQHNPSKPFDHDAVDPFDMVERVQISSGSIVIELGKEDACPIHLPFTVRRRGVETKPIIANQSRELDVRQIANIARAQKTHEQLKSGQSFTQVSQDTGISKRRIQQLIDLAFLALDIVRDVLNGRQPMGFTSYWCLRHDILADWREQRALICNL